MSPRRSKTISFPSGDTSSDIHVPAVRSSWTVLSYGYGGFATSHFGASFSFSFDASAVGGASGGLSIGGAGFGGCWAERGRARSRAMAATRRFFMRARSFRCVSAGIV